MGKKVAVLACLLGLVLMASSVLLTKEVIVGNVVVLGIPVGGKSIEDAVELINKRISELEKGPIVFRAGNLTYTVESDRLKVAINPDRLRSELQNYVSKRPGLVPSFMFSSGNSIVLAAPATYGSPDIRGLADEIALKLSKAPLGTRYGFSGRDLVIMPPEPGQEVKPADVLAVFDRGISGTLVDVPYTPIPAPEHTVLEPLDLVSEFSTEYDEADKDRVMNLFLAAGAIHGQVVQPGKVFSFNQSTGERTLEKGYRYANVVVGDHLEPGLAGGICQVSTTLFNAVAKAGLEIVEVSAHGIPVDYAEPGKDAAVAWGYLDFKFKNPYGNPVVLGAWVESGQVLIRIWGKKLPLEWSLETNTVETYPVEGKRPGLLVDTYHVEKSGGQVVQRKLLMRSYYLPSVPAKKTN